jgi:hypothetical protein
VKVIGLSGYARTGKDTVAKILVEEHGYTRVAYADQLRELTLRVDPYVTTAGTRLSVVIGQYGWERAKDTFPEVRRLLQVIGVGVRDVVGTGAWVEAAYRKMADQEGRYVLPDVRFPNELALVRDLNGLTVRVHRPGYGPVNDHISETALDGERFGAEVWNSEGLELLREHAAWLDAELSERATA